MKKFSFQLWLTLFGFILVNCGKQNARSGDAFILHSRSDAGMFSVLSDVWSLLDCYERGFCSAVKIDFGKSGLYYDASVSLNWFSYYFEPINLGISVRGDYIETDCPGCIGLKIPDVSEKDKDKISGLVKKYIKLKPEIESLVDTLQQELFESEFIIGIHYRGTDKYKEVPRIAFNQVEKVIREQILERNLQKYKLFVATDEQQFLDFMHSKFPDNVVAVPNVERSKNKEPLHFGNSSNQYGIGKNSLIDCLLLSRTNLLIRTASNLSLWSTYFNPDIPVIVLDQ